MRKRRLHGTAGVRVLQAIRVVRSTKIWISTIVLLVAVFGRTSTVVAQTQIPAPCRVQMDLRLRKWSSSPPPSDLAAFASERKIETNVTRGDFDDDGVRDVAVLVVAAEGAGRKPSIAVCLNPGGRTTLFVIADPYCSDGISTTPKGTTAHNYDTDRPVTYARDGISAYCFEKAGGTYVFRNGRFDLVVDSD